MRRRVLLSGLLLTVAALSAPTVAVVPATAQAGDPVLVAAGDISPDPSVTTTDDIRTAQLAVAANPTVVVPIGDLQYYDGAYEKFIHPNGYEGPGAAEGQDLRGARQPRVPWTRRQGPRGSSPTSGPTASCPAAGQGSRRCTSSPWGPGGSMCWTPSAGTNGDRAGLRPL